MSIYDARKDTSRQIEQSTYTVLTIYYVIAAFMFDVLPPSPLALLSNAPQTLRFAMPCIPKALAKAIPVVSLSVMLCGT